MAESRFESEQYTSKAFVESAGAVLFRLSSREICVLHLREEDVYVLAKGRRNCGESTQAAALREVTEETGYSCRLLPLNMYTRAPPAVETEQLSDRARLYQGICEPFTMQLRRYGQGKVKIIWWFVAAVDEDAVVGESQDKEICDVKLFGFEEVLEKLTFRLDREMVQKAIELVENTYK